MLGAVEACVAGAGHCGGRMSQLTRETAAERASRARRERTQDLVTMYVVERRLARMSASPYAGAPVLREGCSWRASGAGARPPMRTRWLGTYRPTRALLRRRDHSSGRPRRWSHLPYRTVKAAMIRDDAL